MRKYSKGFILLMITVLLLQLTVKKAIAAESLSAIRLSGENRILTAIEVSKEVYKTSESVVLAGFTGEVDALTGTLLASAKDAPLLLTAKDSVNKDLKAELERLGVKTVYILGGEVAVHKTVETELAKSYNIKRVSGKNREETAVQVAKEVNGQTKHVFLAKGYGILADALAIGPVSAISDTPVLLTRSESLSTTTLDAMKNLGVTHVTIVGGKVAINESVENQLKEYTVDRISGATREETAIAVAKKYFLNPEKAILANGYVFADALVGGYLGAKKSAPILLTASNMLSDGTAGYVKDNFTSAYILGGHAAIDSTVEINLNKALKARDDENPIVPEKAITINQIPFEINILEPDRSGTVYMKSTYANNTQYPITNLFMEVLLKDVNETVFLISNDTILPGQSSPIFEGFGPSTMKKEDYEILSINVVAENPNGKTIYMEYDTRLKKYDYEEYESSKENSGVITKDDVPLKLNILEPDSMGIVFMESTYRNNTPYPITNLSIKVLLKDKNKIAYLMSGVTVLPGESSPLFYGFGPATMKEEDYEILSIEVTAENPNGDPIYMEYDARLKKYEFGGY